MNAHRPRRTLLVCILLVLCAPPTAWAQEEGVTIDPGAPASKEYALPLETARKAASGSATGPAKRAAERSAQRFGDGITPDEGPAAVIRAAQRKKAEQAGKTSSGSQNQAGSSPNRSQSAQTEAANPRTERLLAKSSTGSDGTVAMAAGGAAVLILALGGGLLMRRRGEELLP
ncbi:MAG: LPXTG cell wall anchor domain-containing protein [Actinomycetota bacterium]|nr:LPXTG cell wall anchor domain-containing protein [Actinomycetota bacterium]